MEFICTMVSCSTNDKSSWSLHLVGHSVESSCSIMRTLVVAKTKVYYTWLSYFVGIVEDVFHTIADICIRTSIKIQCHQHNVGIRSVAHIGSILEAIATSSNTSYVGAM